MLAFCRSLSSVLVVSIERELDLALLHASPSSSGRWRVGRGKVGGGERVEGRRDGSHEDVEEEGGAHLNCVSERERLGSASCLRRAAVVDSGGGELG